MMTNKNNKNIKNKFNSKIENGELEKKEAFKFQSYFGFFLLGFICALIIEKYL